MKTSRRRGLLVSVCVSLVKEERHMETPTNVIS